MKANPLAIAVIALALLGAAVWYTRENPPPDEDAAPKVVDVEEEDIRKLTLQQAGEDPITVVRGEDDEWRFGGGLEIAADDTSIGLMVSSLASLNADRVVSENVIEWGPYDLEDPELAVSYELAEGGGELQFGRDTPTGSGVFARLKGDGRLFTVYRYNKTSFEKSVFDLRDKRLLHLDEDSISDVTVKAGGRTIGFRQEDGDWQIVQPLDLRADDFTVGDLVRAVRTAEMTEVLAEGGDHGDYSFASPTATVTVSDGQGSHELVLAKDGDTHYARSSAQEGVFKVSSTLAESLDKPVADFRNRKLFDFGYADPAHVDVQAGDASVSVVHSEDKWLLESEGGREVDGVKVQTLLDRLRNLTATEFPSDRTEDQARFGLGDAAIQAAVTPEGEGAVPEKVRISSADQAEVYAARDSEPSTYQVEQSAAQDIRRAVEDILKEPEEENSEDSGDETSEAAP